MANKANNPVPFPYLPTSSTFPQFIVNEPYSVKADKKGLEEGKLIVDNYEKVKKLQDIQVGLNGQLKSNNQMKITCFENWGATQNNILLYAKPTSRSEVQSLVIAAINPKNLHIPQIGVGGSYHSWSPVFPNENGLLINICDLKLEPPKIAENWIGDNENDKLRIYLHRIGDKKVVTISPGVTTGELMSFFLTHNVCFESDVILPTVTYGGVLSGGCHGTGKDQQSMSDWIVGMKLIDGKGELQTLDSGDDLLAGQTSLGVLGVVVEFTLEVQEMSICRVQNKFDMKMEDICTYHKVCTDSSVEVVVDIDTKGLSRLLEQYWSVEIFWFPFNGLLNYLLESLPSEGTSASIDDISIKVIPPPDVGETECPPEVKTEVNDPVYSAEIKDHNALMTRLGVAKPCIDLDNILMNLWKPAIDKLWVRGIDIIRKDKKKPHHQVSQEPGIPLYSKLIDAVTHVGGNLIFGNILPKRPSLTPLALNIGFQGVKFQYETLQGDEIVRTPWAVHYRDAIDLMPVYDIEFAFPINIDKPTLAVQAIRRVLWVTNGYAESGKFPKNSKEKEGNHFPLTLCMEMRVLKKSECLLCPASVGDKTHVAYIEVLSTVGTPGYLEYFKDIAREWKKLGGVPHWHKQLLIKEEDMNMVEHIRERFGKERIERFNKVRNKFDPNGIFLNSTMKDILGPFK